MLAVIAGQFKPDTPDMMEIYMSKALADEIAACSVYIPNPTLDAIMCSRSRRTPLTTIRHIHTSTMHYGLRNSQYRHLVTFTHLGYRYGKNHSTMINSIRQLADFIQTDRSFRDKIEAIWEPIGINADAFIRWANHYTYTRP